MSVTPASDIPIAISYTGRDYYSLREQLIARIQDRIPTWTASDPADFGVALVERCRASLFYYISGRNK